MDLQRVFKTPGSILALFLLLACVGITPAAAEYINKAVPNVNDPAHWLDRGGLYATYGSYAAAIVAYNKALELNPNYGKAYFNRGLSYAELGDHTMALVDINKAISLDPTQGNYYYGRGRIMLQSGKRDQALADFRKAANMGDADAFSFLKKMK